MFLALAPFLLPLPFAVALYFPATRAWTRELIQGESHPVELLTLALLLASAVLGALLARRARGRGQPPRAAAFFALFATGCLLIALEESAWGQTILGFDTPEWFRSWNMQGEMTFHNAPGMQGHTEFLRLSFGLGGLVGLWLGRFAFWRPMAPPRVLAAWFLVIAAMAGVDLTLDYVAGPRTLHFLSDTLSEFVEMMVGLTCLLYAMLHLRRSQPENAPVPAG